MKIAIIAVGGLKEDYWRKSAAEYAKRISAYSKLEIIEIAEERPGGGVKIIEREGARALNALRDRDCVAAMCVEGQRMSSERFARFLEHAVNAPRVVFFIGGSEGLSVGVKSRADALISFSGMTFPHQMARVMLLEQIYRAFKIIKNEPYHK
ncbi:MAG: 23S rRNA (pseudouridine(1915)-N(3))-methyltransferase RlmH [Clostridiales bacterium]|nr:23S rRNA (pseudouridine(1915)-N(3))-methyltransferase RlmH [Clostridiales bacterium]